MIETAERKAMLYALRLDLARALGWRVEVRKLSDGSLEWLVLIQPDGAIYRHETGGAPRLFPEHKDGERLLMGWVPDWPRNDGAALAVCLDAQKNMQVEGYSAPTLEIDDEGDVYDVTLGRSEGRGSTIAEALARLALAAKGAR